MNYIDHDKNLFNDYCKGYNYFPLIIPAKRRIIAIGDIHGDFDLAIKLLKLSKVIDDNLNWNGGDTYLVQVGDQLDNYRPTNNNNKTGGSYDSFYSKDKPEDIQVFDLFTKLANQAPKYDGAVISLLGNHEILNSQGNFTYVSKEDQERFNNYDNYKHHKSGFDARKEAFKPGNEYSKIMACTRLPAVIIGNNIFVHAGIISKFTDNFNLTEPKDLYKISYNLKKWLLGLIDKDHILDILTSSKYSLFWDRILGGIPPDVNSEDDRCIQNLDKVLNIFNVGSMIVGHTPQIYSNSKGINSTCNNKLWRIDFAGSFSFDKFDNYYSDENIEYRKPQVLEILNDNNIKIIK